MSRYFIHTKLRASNKPWLHYQPKPQIEPKVVAELMQLDLMFTPKVYTGRYFEPSA